jgi:hypothetical protein
LAHIIGKLNTSEGGQTSPRVTDREKNIYHVHSKALRNGQTVYVKKNAFRLIKKNANTQVEEILENYYKSKAGLQIRKFKKWDK